MFRLPVYAPWGGHPGDHHTGCVSGAVHLEELDGAREYECEARDSFGKPVPAGKSKAVKGQCQYGRAKYLRVANLYRCGKECHLA